MIDGDRINKNYWANVEPEKILAGLSLPGEELFQYLKQGGSILDAGCGSGKVSEYLSEKGYGVTGVDLNLAALQENKNRSKVITYQEANITEYLPFPDESFDAVVVSYLFVSIISLEKQKSAAQEIQRVLKKGGYLWLCEATYSPDYVERYKMGKEKLGEDVVALSFNDKNEIKRVIRHYNESDFDVLFTGLSKVDSSKITVQSPSSGMNVKSLRIVYKKI